MRVEFHSKLPSAWVVLPVLGACLVAVLGTMATGLLFAARYAMTRSYWAVFVEHALWGALVFTVGLGQFFFTGVGILNWR